MEIMKNIFILVMLGLAITGCASAYTSIRLNEDGTYTVTRQKQGAFNVTSSVYNCTAKGAGLDCTEFND